MRFNCTQMESLATGEICPSRPGFDAKVQTQNSFVACVKRSGFRIRQIGGVELMLLDNDKLAVCYISELPEDAGKHELVFPLITGSEFGEVKRNGNSLTLSSTRVNLVLETDPAMAVNNEYRDSLTGKWSRILSRLVSGETENGSASYFGGLGISVKSNTGSSSGSSMSTISSSSEEHQLAPYSKNPSYIQSRSSNKPKTHRMPRSLVPHQMAVPPQPTAALLPPPTAASSMPMSQSLKRISLCLSKPVDDVIGLNGIGFGEDLKLVLSSLDENNEEAAVPDANEVDFNLPNAPFSSLFTDQSMDSDVSTPSPNSLYLYPEGNNSTSCLSNKPAVVASSQEPTKPCSGSEETTPFNRMDSILAKERAQNVSRQDKNNRQPPSIPPPPVTSPTHFATSESSESGEGRENKKQNHEKNHEPSEAAPAEPIFTSHKSVSISNNAPEVINNSADNESTVATKATGPNSANADNADHADSTGNADIADNAVKHKPRSGKGASKQPGLVKTVKRLLGRRKTKNTHKTEVASPPISSTDDSRILSSPLPASHLPWCHAPQAEDEKNSASSETIPSSPGMTDDNNDTPSKEESPTANASLAPNTSQETNTTLESNTSLEARNTHEADAVDAGKPHIRMSASNMSLDITADSTNNGRQTAAVPKLDSNNSISALSFRSLSSRSLSLHTAADDTANTSTSSLTHAKKNPTGWSEIDEMDEIDYFEENVEKRLDESEENAAENNAAVSADENRKRAVTSPTLLRRESRSDLEAIPVALEPVSPVTKRMYANGNKTTSALQHSASSSYSSFTSKNSLNSYSSLSSAGSFSTPSLPSSLKQQQSRQSMMSLSSSPDVNLFTGYLWISKWENARWSPLSQLELRTEIVSIEGSSIEIFVHESSSRTRIKFTTQCEVRRVTAHDTEVRTVDDTFMFRCRDPESSQKFFRTLWALQANGVRAVTGAVLASATNAGSNNTLNRMSFYEDDEMVLNRRKTLFPPTLSKSNLNSRYLGPSTSTILEE